MIFDVTHQQAIDRGMLRHYLADTLNMATAVRNQPNITHDQRIALVAAIEAMKGADVAFSGKVEA